MFSAFLAFYASNIMMGKVNLPPNFLNVIYWNTTGFTEQDFPYKNPYYIAPVIEAKAALSADLETGAILYQKDMDKPLPIASITKLMTVLIVSQENKHDDTIKISVEAAKQEGSKLGLKSGQKFTVEQLIYATLIYSANDAAYALAEHNAPEEEFVQKMNKKSMELGMKSTSFVTPTGLYDSYGDNISTAHDLFILARNAYDEPVIQKAAGTYEYSIKALNTEDSYTFKNRNELLKSYLKVLGLKTGTTDRAGECLIGIIENKEGHRIITIVINSPDRYSETKMLADWTFRAYAWNKN